MAKELDKKIKVSSDTNGLKNLIQGFKDLNKIEDEIGKTTQLLTGKLASMVAKIKEITDKTDELVVAQRLLGITFGQNTKSITEYANSLSNMTGIAESTIYKQVALFGQTADSLGLAAENAEIYTKNLGILASKISMLYNVDYASAAKSLRDAAKGESTTLATMTGIIVKNRTIREELARLGIDREVASLNNAERAILQYIIVSKQLQNVDGATAQAVNSVAWQKQILTQQTQRLATAFGKVLYPILQAILPVLNAILMVITNLVEMFARLVGYKSDIIETTGSISDGMLDIGTSATKASKALNTSLRGFDKLNNIKSPTDTSTSGGVGIDPKILQEFGNLQQEMLNISNKATEISNSIMEWLGFSKDVNGEWEFSEVKLGTLVGILAGSGGILWAISKIYDIIKLMKKIGGLIGAFTGETGATGLATLKTFAQVAGGISLIIFGILELFQGIKELQMGDYFNGIIDILIGVAAAVAGVAVLLGAWPVAIIAGIVLVVAEILKNWETIKSWLNTAKNWLKEKFGIIGEIVASPINMVISLFDGLYKGVKDIIDGIIKICNGDLKGGLTKVFKGIGNIFIGVLNFMIDGLNALISPIRALIVAAGNVMGKDWTMDNIRIPKIPQIYANGGFPEDGLFMANHNELVGKFSNGKTAVANNEQITKGIEEASFQGMMKALNATGGKKQPIEITAEGDASGLLEFITFKQKQQNRRTGL